MAIISAPYAWHSEGFTSSPGTDGSGTRACRSLTDTRDGIRKTKPGKWRTPLPYNRTIVEGETESRTVNVRVDYIVPGSTRKRWMTHAGPLAGSENGNYKLVLPTFPAELALRAEQRALGKLKQQRVNLAVAFGERAATAEMLASTAGRVLHGLRAARRLDVKGVATALGCKPMRYGFNAIAHKDGKAASLWLGYQYGWKPLYSDLYGATAELLDRDNRFQDRYRCHVTAKDELATYSAVESPFSTGGSTLLKGEATLLTRARHRCYCRLDYVLANPGVATLAELGITNPLETAWELVPFSFVADWFVPIGSYLSRLDATTGWSFKGGSMSRLTRASRTCAIRSIRIDSVNAVNQVPQNGSPISRQKAVRLQRTTYSASPSAWLPNIIDDRMLSAGNRAANAVALLTSFFRSR